MPVNFTNKIYLLNGLQEIFNKSPKAVGKRARGACRVVVLCTSEISKEQLVELTALAIEVPNQMMIKRAGAGIKIQFN